MPVREAVQLLADAMKAELQAELEKLPTLPGDVPPHIEQFLQPFEDEDLTPLEYPALVTDLDLAAEAEAELETFAKADARVPIEFSYLTHSLDSAKSRASGAYVLRAMLRVLSRQVGTSLNGVRLLQVLSPRPEFFRFDEPGYLGVALRVHAQMRDEEW